MRPKTKLAVHRAAKSKVRDKLPTMRLLRPWRGYPVGATIRPAGLLRDVLVQEGIGEVVEEVKDPPVETVKAAKKEPEPEIEAEDLDDAGN